VVGGLENKTVDGFLQRLLAALDAR